MKILLGSGHMSSFTKKCLKKVKDTQLTIYFKIYNSIAFFFVNNNYQMKISSVTALEQQSGRLSVSVFINSF